MLPVTPRPHGSVGHIRFNRSTDDIMFLLLVRCFISGSPESRTQRDPVISRIWATCPRLPPYDSSSREGAIRTHDLVFPKHAGWPLPDIPARTFLASGPGGARILVSVSSSKQGLQPSAIPSQLPARGFDDGTKKPGVAHDTGFCVFPVGLPPSVTRAKDRGSAYSPADRRMALYL